MKQWKKKTSMLIVFVFLIGMLGSPVSAASTNLGDSKDNLNGELTEEQKELALILQESFEGYIDEDKNVQIRIKDNVDLENN